jgi:uncharacterized protein YoxC
MSKVMVFILSVVTSFVFVANGFTETTETSGNEVQLLKAEVKELLQRIEQLEQNQAKGEEDLAKHKEDLSKKFDSAKVDLSNALSKLKIKGRAAAGFLSSDKSGAHGSGAFQMPDAKIQFSFQPDDINTFVLRFNLNNAVTSVSATSPLLDYFFLQSKDFLPFLKNTPYSLSGRLGRFKLGFGEETWSNNPIEGMVPSNSAGNAGVTDEGLELAGKVKLDKLKIANYTFTPLGWVVSVSNGNSGTSTDTSSSKALMGKLYYSPINPLYLSVSYYNSGNLKADASEFSIAGLITAPTGATNWRRDVWEVDGRYDFGKGKKALEPVAFSDSKAILRLSYGAFHDTTSTAAARERSGNFGFVDGLYNLNKKFYLAGRYSFVDLDSEVTATLNSVTANKYDRYSLGMGYRWSQNTIVKVSYDWNKNSGPNISDTSDNLLSALVTAQF